MTTRSPLSGRRGERTTGAGGPPATTRPAPVVPPDPHDWTLSAWIPAARAAGVALENLLGYAQAVAATLGESVPVSLIELADLGSLALRLEVAAWLGYHPPRS